MADAGSIWVKFGLNADELLFGLDKVRYKFQEVSKDWRTQTFENARETASWGAAIALTIAPVVALGAAVFMAGKRAGDFGMEIEDNARMLGISTNTYQQWRHVATAADVSVSGLTNSMRMLTTRMNNKEGAEGLALLGVATKDLNGNARKTDEVFKDVIVRLGQIEDPVRRNQVALQIFSRGWYELAPMMELSRGEIDKLLGQAEIFSPDKIKSMANFNTQLDLLNERLDHTYTTIGTKTIPVISTFAGMLDRFFQSKTVEAFFKQFDYGLRVIDAIGQAMKANTKEEMEAVGSRFYIQEEQRKILEAIPDTEYGNKWNRQEAQKAGEKGGYDFTGGLAKTGGLEIPDTSVADAEKAATEKLTAATKDYLAVLKDVNAEKQSSLKLTRNYLEDVQFAGKDISKIRSLTMGYNRAMRDQQERLGDVEFTGLQAAATYKAAGGTAKTMTLTINGGVNLSKDYPLPQMLDDAERYGKVLQAQRKAAGVRT